MKLFIFCVVSAVSLWSLPPLPPLPALPSLPSLPSAPASLSSAASQPALPAASSVGSSAAITAPAAADEQRLPPIMVDEKSLAVKNVNIAEADERAKKFDDILKNVSDIHQQVVAFQAVEHEIDGLFAGTSKKIDDFLVAADGFVGKAGAYVEDLEADFEKKKTELNACLIPGCSAEIQTSVAEALKIIEDAKAPVEELKKLLASARDGRSAIGREEDTVRQKVVDFKKSSVDVAAFYARAVTAKNGLLVGGGDAVAVLSQCTDNLKKVQELVNSLKTKDGQEIRDLLKKLDGLLSSGKDAEKTIEAKLSELKKTIERFSKLEGALSLAQKSDLIKKENIVLPKKDDATTQAAKQTAISREASGNKEEKDSASDVDSSDKQEAVLGVRENIFQEVFLTVQRGTQLLFDKVQDGLGDVVVMLTQLIAKQASGSGIEEKSGASTEKAVEGSSSSVEKGLAVEPKGALVATEKPAASKSDSAKVESSSPDASALLVSINKLADSIVTGHELKEDAPVSLPALPPLPALSPVSKPV